MFARSKVPSMQSASSRVSQLSSHIQGSQFRSMASVTYHKLNTGASIPAIGFGTWQDKDDQEKAVLEALKAGFRHIDGAASSFPFSLQLFSLLNLIFSLWHRANDCKCHQEEWCSTF
jgi:hypothetical protein